MRGINYNSLGANEAERLGTDAAIYNKPAYNWRGQLTEIIPNNEQL